LQVAKLPYKPEEAEEFERAWLALADIHIQGGKFDLAQVRQWQMNRHTSNMGPCMLVFSIAATIWMAPVPQREIHYF
jgi:hypothetical protein